MNITYAKYEPDKGFEEKQALIYNKAIKPYGGDTVTAERIKKRIKRDKPDFNGIRFALQEDSKEPLAYIQYRARDTSKTIWIGYPWAVPGTPEEVQDKLFSKLLDYVKEKYPSYRIQMGYINEKYEKMHAFAKNKGFSVVDTSDYYIFNLKQTHALAVPKYPTKIASPDDLDKLMDLATGDTSLLEAFGGDASRMKTYMTDRLTEQETVVVLDTKGQFISAGAPLRDSQPNSTLIRFTATRPGFEDAIRSMIASIAKEHEKNNPKNYPLGLFLSTDDPPHLHELIKDLEAKKESGTILHRLNKTA